MSLQMDLFRESVATVNVSIAAAYGLFPKRAMLW